MRMLLSDIVLFCCAAAFVVGITIQRSAFFLASSRAGDRGVMVRSPPPVG
jgi:hypothetical protein